MYSYKHLLQGESPEEISLSAAAAADMQCNVSTLDLHPSLQPLLELKRIYCQ